MKWWEALFLWLVIWCLVAGYISVEFRLAKLDKRITNIEFAK